MRCLIFLLLFYFLPFQLCLSSVSYTHLYFSFNALLPFAGEGRREAIEEIRHTVASHYDVASCLEIGPRYLHSTGQLHKGGPKKGVFLILSADEPKDIEIDDPRARSLGELAKAQAPVSYTHLITARLLTA